MKKFDELKLDERNEIVMLFSTWLKGYTHEVIVKVMSRRDEILNNDFAMNLLKELKEREEKEYNDFMHSVGNLFYDFETFSEYDPHNHPLTHARSYRDILHDMYIK